MDEHDVNAKPQPSQPPQPPRTPPPAEFPPRTPPSGVAGGGLRSSSRRTQKPDCWAHYHDSGSSIKFHRDMVLNLRDGESCKKLAKYYNNPNQKRPEREDEDGADEDGEDEDGEDEDKEEEEEDEEDGADDGETDALAQAENESQDVS
jgi:hypothetical protein